MKSLLIDTSLNRIIVAVANNNTILSLYNEECYRDFSAQVMKIIDEQVKKSNLSIKEIDKFFVVTGPGSFTGIRIGVTIVKVMAWSLNKKIIPLSSLELIATTINDEEIIIPYIDARRNCVYTGMYDSHLNIIYKDSYMSNEELLESIPSNKKVIGISYDEAIKGINTITPKIDILKIINKHQYDEGISAHEIKPNYLKMTEAEVKNNDHN